MHHPGQLYALLGVLLTSSVYVSGITTLNVTITKETTVDIPATLGGGYMWEDINHSGDGGLYGTHTFESSACCELLQNRAFQAVTPGNITSARVRLPNVCRILSLTSWIANGTEISVVNSTSGVYSALPNSLQVVIPADATGPVGFANTGYWELDGDAAKGTTFWFGMFSLFPPTFKGRENGMRIDLAEAMAGTKPSVWRFPGGNNLEGVSFDQRWKWNETIGPLENRPGRLGNWEYPNTDGLGLLEYLNWAEDLNATVILGVWDGISIGDYSDLPDWPILPQDQLQPYIDDVVNEIEFITADAETNEWGALRASLGRAEPYALHYIEIGNEDQFQEDSYAAHRWNMFVTQLGAKFPDLVFIATSYPSLALDPAYTYIDYHMYNSPPWFLTNAFMFDEYPRNGTKYFVGEYAVTSTNDTEPLGVIGDGRFAYPTLQGAVAEAAFMTGMERNSDVVFAAAYAPSLQHIASYQWTPDLITFDAGNLVKSVSYYAQQMFSENRGTQVLTTAPVSSALLSPIFWVASHNNVTNDLILKVANAGNDSVSSTISLAFDIDTSTVGTLTQLAPGSDGLFNVSNTLDEPEVVVPVTSNFTFSDDACAGTTGCVFGMEFPAMSHKLLCGFALGQTLP
ncbi:glycoside hydrolase [Stereum hirsutum FP-91666 SS1]|uniref:glycoside hydrolase n=1 Tax=Stereum hirsutum (strain FP-91666) TaxID=721885 RepID=UPI000440FC29|nr:glycoside hydrolase [Stereum hirsutum FP-91666 SS1]EIM91767.1 glycoside hydrolase [Stereum hirsutum FP-91666 SS1]